MTTDFKRTLDAYTARVGEFRFVEVPVLQYLMVDGHGDPDSGTDWADALAALYPVAYALKFASRKRLGHDYVVPPLEAQWWADDLAAYTSARDKSQWDWTAMIMAPAWVTPELLDDVATAVAARRPGPVLDAIRLEELREGHCVQTLHLGPYDEEAAVLRELHLEVIPGAGLRPTGKHHEIYLSDARRVEPARLRTILRQPVEPA